jgi:hypothetical protein
MHLVITITITITLSSARRNGRDVVVDPRFRALTLTLMMHADTYLYYGTKHKPARPPIYHLSKGRSSVRHA